MRHLFRASIFRASILAVVLVWPGAAELTSSASTGFPAELRFMDGKLAVIEQTAKPVKVDIDK